MAHFAAFSQILNRLMDEQVPIMTKTANNNHNFGISEGFWQILTLSIFP